MFLGRLLETVWRGGTYGRLAALLGVLLVAGVSAREAPLVRNVPPVRTVASRQALVRHGRIIRVTGPVLVSGQHDPMQRPVPSIFEVQMTALAPDDWQLAPADVVLEFEDASTVNAQPPDIADNSTSLIFAPGIERTARLRFPAPAGNGETARPRALRLRRPRVRFMLEDG